MMEYYTVNSKKKLCFTTWEGKSGTNTCIRQMTPKEASL